MGEPGGLPAMGSHRVGHDRSNLAAAAARASKAQSVLGLNSVSNVQGMHLLENSGRSKNFSHNLQSANPSRNKDHLWRKTGLGWGRGFSQC